MVLDIVKTQEYSGLLVKEEQLAQVSSPEIVQNALRKDNCLGFYAYEEKVKIGFALVRKFGERQFFLWDFLIDSRYQGCGKGKEFLRLLMDRMTIDFSAEVITTTYIYGNETAKRLYENFGFVQTDVVCEDDIHEVNMLFRCITK